MIKRILITLAGGLAIAAFPFLSASAASSVTVSPYNMHGWFFYDDKHDTKTTATGSMVQGPDNPPAGTGSAELRTTNSNEGQAIVLNSYSGTKVSSITSLSYSTFVQTGNNTVAPALQFNFDPNVSDTKNGWYGRMVYEPYMNGTVIDNQWQSWNVMDPSAVVWLSWGNGAIADYGQNPCPQSAPCTLAQLKSAFPNAGIDNGNFGAVLFKAGSWSTPFIGNVDAFTIGINNNNTTYNFELYNVPTNKDQCKNDGYKSYTDSDGNTFKNQGQCVSWTQHSVNGNGNQSTGETNTTDNNSPTP